MSEQKNLTINGMTRSELLKKMSEPMIVKTKEDIISRLNEIFSVFNYDVQMGDPSGEMYVKLHAGIVVKDDMGSLVIRKDACSGYYVADLSNMTVEEAKKQTDAQVEEAMLDIYVQLCSSLGIPVQIQKNNSGVLEKESGTSKRDVVKKESKTIRAEKSRTKSEKAKKDKVLQETESNTDTNKDASEIVDDVKNSDEPISDNHSSDNGVEETISTSIGSLKCIELQICTEFEEQKNGSLICKVRNLHHPAEGIDLNKMPTLVIWNSKVAMIEEKYNVSKERFVRSYKPNTTLPCKCIRESAGDKVIYRFDDVWLREKN